MSLKHTFISFILGVLIFSCTDARKTFKTKTSFDSTNLSYWNDGKAEVSSYKLEQARYGELHEGTSVLVYVTEPFSTKTWTKSDSFSPDNKDVLKLNFTKKFNTGIYPYSMMTSSFFPLRGGKSSLKISTSSQEWCGHTYMELNNNNDYDFQVNSYFQSEKQGKLSIKRNYLEDDFWSLIRLNPYELPVGEMNIIPSFFYIRLMHKEIKAYSCIITKSEIDKTTTSYSLFYPNLDRRMTINFNTEFPHTILSWKETYISGWGNKAKTLTTTASLIKSIRTTYWSKNSNKHSSLRTELGLNN